MTLKIKSFPGYSRLGAHIWKFGLRSLEWEKACNICLSGSRLPHSIKSFPVPYLYLKSSWFVLFLFYRWIVPHIIYVPRFHYPLVNWKISRLVPFPSYCEQSDSDYLWSRMSSPLEIYQGMVQLGHIISFLRILHTAFQRSWTTLQSNHQWRKVSFSCIPSRICYWLF